MKHSFKIFSPACILAALITASTLGAQDLTVDGNLYVRGNIELEDSIRMRDHMEWRGAVSGVNDGEVFYIVLSEKNEYFWPDLEVTISGAFGHSLNQGSISKKFSFRHYGSNSGTGTVYGPIETDYSNYGYLRRHICIGEPHSSSDGLRIPIIYFDRGHYASERLRVKVSFSKGWVGNAGQPGNFVDWTPYLTTPEPYDTTFYTDELIAEWNQKKLYGTVVLDEPQGDISMGAFGAE